MRVKKRRRSLHAGMGLDNLHKNILCLIGVVFFESHDTSNLNYDWFKNKAILGKIFSLARERRGG